MSVSLDFIAPPSISPRRRRASRRLLSAIHRNHLALAYKALAQHADLTWLDPVTGWTPLELAAVRWRPTLISIILSRMPEVASASLRPRALDLLLEQWPAHDTQSAAAQSTLEALLEDTGLRFLESRHPWGWLGYAVEASNPNLANLLVSLGVPVGWEGPEGQSLLHLAVEIEAPMMVNWCLDQGLGVSRVDAEGNTPLHIAAQSGSLGLADLLVQAGSDLNAPNHDGQTPLSLAAFSGREGDEWQARLQKHFLSLALPAPLSSPESFVRF